MIWVILYLLFGAAALFILTYTDEVASSGSFGDDYGICVMVVFVWPVLIPAVIVWVAHKFKAKKK